MKKNFTKGFVFMVLALIANIAMAQTYTYPVKGQQGFSLSDKTRDGMHVSYELGSFSLNPLNYRGEEMSEISINGIVLPNTAGYPNLPTESRLLAIPQGSTATLNVVRAERQVIKNVNIAPALRIQAEVEEPDMDYKKDPKVYNKNAYYPENPFEIGKSYIRGVDAVTLSITPFQYNPVTKELVVYTDVELSLSYEGGNGHFGEDRLRSPYWDPILAAELMNYDQLPVIDYEARMQQWIRDGEEGAEYLIITPNNDDWAPYAQQLKEFRTKQGIITEVYRLDEMPATTTTAMKQWFHNAYHTWDIAPVAVCLLGDHNTNMSQGIPAETTSHPYNGSCITNVPLTAVNFSGAIQNAVSACLSGVSVMAGMATGAAPITAMGVTGLLNSAANTALNSKPSVQRSGNLGGSAGIMSIQKPYVIIERPNLSVPDDVQHYAGQTANITALLDNVSGFTMVEYVHLHDIDATNDEIKEIESLLKAGVIL